MKTAAIPKRAAIPLETFLASASTATASISRSGTVSSQST